MSAQDKYTTIENKMDNRLETILEENRHEMEERKQMILLGLNSHASEAKEEVHHHITQLVKVKSALSNSKIY